MLTKKFRKLGTFDKNVIIKFIKDIKLTDKFEKESESDKETILQFLTGLGDNGIEYLCGELKLNLEICQNSIKHLKN